MAGFLAGCARRIRARLGRPREAPRPYPDWEAIEAGPDWRALDEPDRRIIELALPYTMTGVAPLQALVDAVRYCVPPASRAPSPSAGSGAAARCWR